MASGKHQSPHELAAIQSRFRGTNERLRASAASHRFGPADPAPFICECDDPRCFECVMLSLEEYDRIRANASWFLLAAGHEDAEATYERIIEAENGYAIVEKTGAAGVEAERLRLRKDSGIS